MKRALLLSALLVFLGLSQLQAQEGVKVGFRASPLIGWASITDSSKTSVDGLETKARLGFSFDFVLTLGFNEQISFRTGLNIATRGFGYDTSGELLGVAFSSKTRVAVTTLELPIGLKFRSPEIGSGMYVIGLLGANVEFNLNNRITVETTVGGVSDEVETRDNDDINIITVSPVIGAGLDWEFDWGMLEFALSYHLGLMNLLDKDEFGGLNSRLSYIALNIGYFF